MSCYSPCFIQRITNPYTGEVSTKFLGSVKNCVECNDVLREKYSGEKSLDLVYRTYDKGYLNEFIQIPCGKCIGCRIDYKRSWADRLTYHSIGKEENSYFITLTYDDDHLEDLEHSVNYDLYSLNFEHMTDFIKKLRNKFRDVNIDYYYSGEYGDSLFRPHFHLMVFNLPLDDLEFWKLDTQKAPVYTSDTIHKLWQKGICSISKFAWLNAAYTAGYVEKKRDGRANCEYTVVGLTPEGCRMSRRPGIAYEYYLDHYHDIWKNNGLNVFRDVNSSGKLGIPRYFRKLAVDKGIGLDDFLSWQKDLNNLSNVLNPLKVENSSFDLGRVRDLLKFEEREILSRQKNKVL